MPNKILLLLFCSAWSILCIAQHRPIEIEYEYHDDRSISFFAVNHEYKNYTVTLDFTTIMNLRTTRPVPYSKTILHGKTFLLKLIPINPESRTDYGYTYSYREGCLKTNPDSSLVYLLPFKPGQSNEHRGFIDKGKSGSSKPTSCAFLLSKGDTIYATRGGVVSEAVDSLGVMQERPVYDDNWQRIQIFHQDCTFGEYACFRKLLVKVGQTVYPGQAIGIAGGSGTGNIRNLNFTVAFYKEPEAIHTTDQRQLQIEKVAPKFHTTNGVQYLKSGIEYTSEHPEAMITQEMNKRQVKRWKKRTGRL